MRSGWERLKPRLKKAEERLAALEARWEHEKKAVDEIRALREALEAQHAKRVEAQNAGGTVTQPTDEERKVQADYDEKVEALGKLQGDQPLMQVCVDGQTIAEVVAGWTGIPVGKMVADEIQSVIRLHEKLGERVIGQNHALEAIAQRIRTSRANLTDPRSRSACSCSSVPAASARRRQLCRWPTASTAVNAISSRSTCRSIKKRILSPV